MHTVFLFFPITHFFQTKFLLDSYIQWVGGKKGYAGDHYVAHRRHNQVWVMYDDSRVNKSPIHGQAAVNLAFFRNTNTRNPPPMTVDLARIRHIRGGRGRGAGNRGKSVGPVSGKGKGKGKSSSASVNVDPINVSSTEPVANVEVTQATDVDQSTVIDTKVGEDNIDEPITQPEPNVKSVQSNTGENVIAVDSQDTPVVPNTENLQSENVLPSQIIDPTVEPNVSIAGTSQQPNVSRTVETPVELNIEGTQGLHIPDLAGTQMDKDLLDYLTSNTVNEDSKPKENVSNINSENVTVEVHTVDDPEPPNVGDNAETVPIIGHLELNTQEEYEQEIKNKASPKFLVVSLKKHVNLLKRYQEGNVTISPQKSAMHRLCKIRNKQVPGSMYLNLDLIAHSVEPGETIKVHTGDEEFTRSEPAKKPVPSSSSGSSDDEDKYGGDTEVEEEDHSKPTGIPLYACLV